MSVDVDIQALLESGAHFGHKTSRWHPKMAPYIHSKRGEAHIINLEKTVEALQTALPEVEKIAQNGKKILFVGTKKQMQGTRLEPIPPEELVRVAQAAKEGEEVPTEREITYNLVQEKADEAGMPYVIGRWVGGTLTNVTTVNRQIKKLKDLERRMASGELEMRYSKLEVQRFQEEIDLLNTRYGGIKDMTEQPAAVLVLDAIQDKNAIKEANTLKIPVFAICDTNVDPTHITYPIPANDDSVKATTLILDYFVAAIKEGKEKAGKTSK